MVNNINLMPLSEFFASHTVLFNHGNTVWDVVFNLPFEKPAL
jgi:hypothetical protein